MNESDLIFNAWKSQIRDEDIAHKYKADDRREYITTLVNAFKKKNIPVEEVGFFREKVMFALTTREGRKGTGRYKGWKESVYDDFDIIVSEFYAPVDLFNGDDIKKASIEDEEWWMTFQDMDGSVRKWLTEKYGFSRAKYKLACTVGHQLNKEYALDLYGVKV